MEPDFDMESAVSDIGSGLGFETTDPAGSDDVNLEVSLDGAQTTDPAAAAVTDPAVSGEKPAGEVTDPAAAAVDPAATVAAEPPKTWRKEAAAEWAALPPTVKDEILKREEDMFKGIEQYKNDATYARHVQHILSPYEQVMQQHNINPLAQIQGLMQSHYTLAFGTPEEKTQLFMQVAKDYGVDLKTLASSIPDTAYIPPEVANLQKTVEGLQSKLTEREQAEFQDKVQHYTREVEAFAADPKNIYFNDLANDIVVLMKSGTVKSLAEAYETALWRNPVTRQKELDRQTAERQEAQRKRDAEAAAAAKKATAANVKSVPKGKSAAAPLGSMDDTLQESLAAIRNRV